MEEIKKIEVQGQQYGVADMLMRSVMGGNAQVIEWSHTHNMNDYKDAGTYRIKGERTGNPLDDNLPIMNQGSGHTIDGVLYVLDSSLANGSGNTYDCTVTQFLMLSNRVGGQEGDMYMRSGYGANKGSLTWKPWEKYQTNLEVGVVSDDATHDATTLAPINSNGLKTFVDNGIYSGIYLTQEALSGDSTKAQTFVMVIINNYAAAGDNKTITQIKFAVANTGEYSMERRSRGSDGKWSGWINEYNDLSARIDEKAPKVGYAPDLKVNFAKELVGRGEATPQVIGKIRPTGEISIGDGNATIAKVKGKSVVWNQGVADPWSVNNCTIASQNDVYLITPKAEGKTLVGIRYLGRNISDVFSLTHKYLCTASVRCTNEKEITLGQMNASGDIHISYCVSETCSTTWKKISFIWEEKEKSIYYYPNCIRYIANDALDILYVRDWGIYDLTQMFGAGNEPTTIEEFEARKPLGVTDEYNEGEIISYDGANELQSIGFNAYNGNYAKVIGGQKYHALGNITSIGFASEVDGETTAITLDSEGMFTPTEDGYVYAEGTDICIHLAHTYTPEHTTEYEEDTLQLPDVKAIKDKYGNPLFPYGLLSAGSAHDEITATKAIKRIGVVDMGTLNWTLDSRFTYTQFFGYIGDKNPGYNIISDKYAVVKTGCTAYTDKTISGVLGEMNNRYVIVSDASYTSGATFKAAMQGVLLYYELAEPIEVDLEEPLNLTYEAWDFGTEELHTKAKTTPLNADISYQFNAVDRIRENTTKASALEARIAQLEAMLTQMARANESNE